MNYRFILTIGGGYCICSYPETDQEIIRSLTDKFGNRLIRIEIGGRILEVKHG